METPRLRSFGCLRISQWCFDSYESRRRPQLSGMKSRRRKASLRIILSFRSTAEVRAVGLAIPRNAQQLGSASVAYIRQSLECPDFNLRPRLQADNLPTLSSLLIPIPIGSACRPAPLRPLLSGPLHLVQTLSAYPAPYFPWKQSSHPSVAQDDDPNALRVSRARYCGELGC